MASGATATETEPENLAEFKTKVRPVLARYCFDCHGPKEQEGDVRIDTLNPDLVNGTDVDAWREALERLTLGEMPPPKAKQPTAAERAMLVAWLRDASRKAGEAQRYADGRVLMRRLTRYEYQNTMRDLLGVELDFVKNLPPDPPSHDGFLNNGATLEMSASQMAAALHAARLGLGEAIVSGEKPTVYSQRAEKTVGIKLPKKGSRAPSPEFMLGIKEFPYRGEFRIRIRAGANIPAGHGAPRLQVQLGFTTLIDSPRKRVGEVEVTASVDQPQTLEFRGRIEDYPQPSKLKLKGVFMGMVVFIDFVDADGKDTSRQNIVVHSVEFEAPVLHSWPPPSHTRILPATEDRADEPRYVRQVLRRFMTRAFRRPATDAEIERTATLFDAVRKTSGSLEEAMRRTLVSVLVSPHFLYVVETRSKKSQAEPVSDFELATRLSYFLRSSMPNETLSRLAREGKLRDAQTLEKQVHRMLEGQRGVEFAGRLADQWFGLDGVDRVAVNPEFYPDFDNGLKEHLRAEPRAFLTEILRSNLSCLNLLDSDWTMLNRPLAKYYGIPGPRSLRFERVALKDEHHRGGLLGQASILLRTSNGESSDPIKRAVWILDRLLGTPPEDPPADVPALDPESPDLAGLSLKQKLVLHRKKESCNTCHRGIDPWGVPLENFSAIGQWQTVHVTRTGKKTRVVVPVDASSVLPDGTKINGFEELKQYLLQKRRKQFASSVVRHVAAYSLGRSLDNGDQESIRSLTQQFVKNDFRLKDLIVAIVKSDLFQIK